MLPFTADILFSSFEQYNRSVWPLPPLACLLALAALLLTLRPLPFGDRLIAIGLAAGWLWTGIHFQILYFARFDFVAPAYGGLFIVEGLLLIRAGLLRRPADFRFRPDLSGWIGLVLAVVAIAVLPLVDGLAGDGWQSVRVVGLAPGPTAVLTLGLLLLGERRAPVHLAVIPLLWTLVAGATAWILWIPQDLALPIIGVASFGLLVWKTRRRSLQVAA